MTQPPAPKPKRAYRKPAVRTYGALAALTRAVGASGMGDGGGGGNTMNMTSL